MATVRNFEVISDELNVVGICTSGNYTKKVGINLYNYTKKVGINLYNYKAELRTVSTLRSA
jgi:hypothetical protein